MRLTDYDLARIAPVVIPPAPDVDPAQLMRLMTDDEQNEIMELGRQHEELRWRLGNRILEKVERLGWPVRQTCFVYARLAKYSDSRRTREFFYCSRFYSRNQGLFARFGDMDWDILNFARKTQQPSITLSKAAAEGYTLDELKAMFPSEADPPETQRALRRYPVYIKPLVRWLKNRVKAERWAEVESVVGAFLGHVREWLED